MVRHGRRRGGARTWIGGVRAALAPIVIAILAGGEASASPLDLAFEVRWGPVVLAEIETSARLDDGYQMGARLRTVGWIGVLFPWEANSSVRGLVDGDGKFVPDIYSSDGVFRGDRRRAELRYSPDRDVIAEVSPAAAEETEATARWTPVAAALRQGTIDPLTATVAMARRQGSGVSACEARLRIFDGRYRYDLVIEDRGESRPPDGDSALFKDLARLCEARVERLGGFPERAVEEGRAPARLRYWLAAPAPEMPAVPVHVELEGERGQLDVVLTRIGPRG